MKTRFDKILDFVYKMFEAMTDTQTTRDIVFAILVITLCSLTMMQPLEYLEVFKAVVMFACGYYFRGKN